MPSRKWPLIAIFLGIALLFISPAASDTDVKPDLICHTSNPQDCYPRVFEPTDEFQVLHDDQEIPNGLHVRLNMETGLKEAKINVPDEMDPSLEGLPVDQGMVAVEQEARDEPYIPGGAPQYENVGKIKGPQREAQSFVDAMKMLSTGKIDDEAAFDEALDGLEELAHDVYYGLKVAEDPAVLKSLCCHMAGLEKPATEGSVPRDQQAAAILAGSLQNNPTALTEVVKAWSSIIEHKCPKSGKVLGEHLFSSVTPPTESGREAEVTARVKAQVAAINGLIKDPSIRAEFLRRDAMRDLLRVLIPEGKEWAGAQRKVGQLVLDNFLDEDMGAVLGQWPTGPKITDEMCKREEWRTAEGCWDYNVARIAKASKASKGHWSKDLLDRLTAVRESGRVPEHVEL
ncbi:nucleotide exchange factor sil1 [Lecanicillium sp. MT-2017a]|nr:nucleotide exchange factor sil1 [Lecanicillium sp. MT-2017a]